MECFQAEFVVSEKKTVKLLVEISEEERWIGLSISGHKMTLDRGLNFLIFRHLFLNKAIKLITIQPQKYSLGYEFSSHQQLRFKDIPILITDVSKCTIDVIYSIIYSEDYWRGLLLVLEYRDQDLSREYLAFINVLDFLDGSPLAAYRNFSIREVRTERKLIFSII